MRKPTKADAMKAWAWVAQLVRRLVGKLPSRQQTRRFVKDTANKGWRFLKWSGRAIRKIARGVKRVAGLVKKISSNARIILVGLGVVALVLFVAAGAIRIGWNATKSTLNGDERPGRSVETSGTPGTASATPVETPDYVKQLKDDGFRKVRKCGNPKFSGQRWTHGGECIVIVDTHTVVVSPVYKMDAGMYCKSTSAGSSPPVATARLHYSSYTAAMGAGKPDRWDNGVSTHCETGQ